MSGSFLPLMDSVTGLLRRRSALRFAEQPAHDHLLVGERPSSGGAAPQGAAVGLRFQLFSRKSVPLQLGKQKSQFVHQHQVKVYAGRH